MRNLAKGRCSSARDSVLPRRELIARLAGTCGAVWLGPGMLGSRRNSACPALRRQRISWLVGWSPGGGYDTYSRLMEAPLERALEAEVVIENMPGAAGILAARRLSAARPDGRTLGILNGVGMMLAPYSSSRFAPQLETDFTVLGRIVANDPALVTGPELGVTSFEEFVARGRQQPLVFGATGPTTSNVLLEVALARMAGIQIELVLGFPGSQELFNSLLRGDLDATVVSEESIRTMAGLTPLLRFSSAHGSSAARDEEIPELLGEDGMIARHPELFVSAERAAADAEALSSLLSIGRLVAAPPGLPAELHRCLEAATWACLRDEGLRVSVARARRSLDPAPAHEVLAHVRASRHAVAPFADIVKRAVERANR